MSDPQYWQHFGILAYRSGSLRAVSAPGLMLGRFGPHAFVQVLGRSVSIFDTRDECLPFSADCPDAPGFWVGHYYVAFNRGVRS